MRTILLVCSEGMSTSFLTTKMQAEADAQGMELKIYARPENLIEEELEHNKIDCILLGPQVAYMKTKIEERVAGKASLGSINALDFGRCNVSKVLEQALVLMRESQ